MNYCAIEILTRLGMNLEAERVKEAESRISETEREFRDIMKNIILSEISTIRNMETEYHLLRNIISAEIMIKSIFE